MSAPKEASLASDVAGRAEGPDSTRRRLIATLFGGVAAGSIAYYASATLGPLAAEDVTGARSFAGLPSAVLAVGTGFGATVVSRIMARSTRRRGLICGYAVGLVGLGVSVVAVESASFPLLLLGGVGIGFGHAPTQLARYAAAEMVADGRRASALGLVVWAATIGAITGPNLLAPAARLAGDFSLGAVAGGYALGMSAIGVAILAYVLLLRPDPSVLAVGVEAAGGAPDGDPWREPSVRLAVVAMSVATAVMVLIMSVTPVHVRGGGHGLGSVGLVMSAHFAGMFALAPLAGLYADRRGRVEGIVVGLAGLAAAAASAPWLTGLALAVPLMLLGLGWSFAFVSASALLTDGMRYGERAALQGSVDTTVWLVTAVAAASSGAVLDHLGFPALCTAGIVLLAIPAWVTLRVAPRLLHAGR